MIQVRLPRLSCLEPLIIAEFTWCEPALSFKWVLLRMVRRRTATQRASADSVERAKGHWALADAYEHVAAALGSKCADFPPGSLRVGFVIPRILLLLIPLGWCYVQMEQHMRVTAKLLGGTGGMNAEMCETSAKIHSRYFRYEEVEACALAGLKKNPVTATRAQLQVILAAVAYHRGNKEQAVELTAQARRSAEQAEDEGLAEVQEENSTKIAEGYKAAAVYAKCAVLYSVCGRDDLANECAAAARELANFINAAILDL